MKGMGFVEQRWTLHVEDFGTIKEADIEISPLMLFVGDNNSGKSYLMSLLWGLLTVGGGIFFSDEAIKLDSYLKCETWFVDNYDKDVEVTDEVEELFRKWFNDLLDKNKERLMKRIFNQEIEIGKLYITNFYRKPKLRLESKGKLPQEMWGEILSEICWELIGGSISAPRHIHPLAVRSIKAPKYLPASRTGFMLSYESILDNALDRAYVGEINQESDFTRPYIDFMKVINKFDTLKTGHYPQIAEFIEENILFGKVIAIKQPVPKFRYIPKGTDKVLPLHLASSIVTELAPVVLLLKSPINYNLLIIEEPEAHLHLKLQLLVARAIIKLVNAGLPVWISTHSDTILQQINNMINLNRNPERDRLMTEYNYQKDDLIEESLVNIYQFDIQQDQKTKITKLVDEEGYGFVAPTINETLHAILKETRAFEKEDD